MNPRLAADFDPALIRASRSALLELARTLKHYSEALVLVGGWVPYLLIENHPRPGIPFTHVGSIDIDLVVDPGKVGEEEYATIVEMIGEVGWKGIGGKRFSFFRTVPCEDGIRRDIQVDFLTSQVKVTGREHRHRPIQPDLQARTMRGAELALDHRGVRKLSGTLPGGAETTVEFLMLDVAGCLGTKGIALGERFKHKDAYDIVSILDDYGSGIPEIARLIKPFRHDPLMEEAIRVLADKFRTERSEGPAWYSEFLGGDGVAREASAQRALQLASEFLRLLQ
ncbi:MAG: hypothetical protein JRN54_03105 [Nitrososphaerota archaeon]|jgi:hypothetical protein|nr:hypothetical protein [Nitrososphaerota archaeon]